MRNIPFSRPVQVGAEPERFAQVLAASRSGRDSFARRCEELLRALLRCEVLLVSSATHAIGASFRGRPLGTFGVCGAISFRQTKNVGCGEGGAIILRDGSLLERAEILRDKGNDRQRFERGLVDRYTWVDIGSSYTLSEL